MKRSHSSKPQRTQKKALENITGLFSLAGKVFGEDPTLSKRYVFLARKTAMKYKVTLPSELKRQFCKKCGTFLKPAANVRVRLKDGKLVYLCKGCKSLSRIPYKPAKK